uniref:CSON012391 protein n=1 Tax=Culicoides sonorensis TaxID=179676 RepID=A0A336M5F2_CULSO
MGIPFDSDVPASARLKTPNEKLNSHNFQRDSGLKLEVQEFVGNHKEFRIDTNSIHLRIIGNNNRVILKCNHGKLDVIGHATKVKVLSNSGKINYIGNNGKIYIGRRSQVTNVHYTGNQGSVKLLDADFIASDHIRHQQNRTNSNENVNRLSGSSTKSEEDKPSPSAPLLEPPTPPPIVLINVKNNISLPNIDDLTQLPDQTLNAKTTFKISNSSTDICKEV